MYPSIKLSLQGLEIQKKWEMYSFSNESGEGGKGGFI